MVQQWVRPLLNARVSFQDARESVNDPRAHQKLQALKTQVRPALVADSKRKRARVPERPWFSFSKPPTQKEFDRKERSVNFKRKSIEKRFKKINADKSVSGIQAAHVSLTGRGRIQI